MASIPSNPTTVVETPDSAEALAELLGEAVASGQAVTPIGGSSKLGFGNQLTRETIRISTSKLDRVLAYEPDDMTISVEAGSTIASVWQTLSDHGLTIPIEVPLPTTETIGGLIATGLCGPRRYGSGSLRDALIGIRAAYPDGTLGAAGGMVVKNVSGFDLMRMHLGALGTLGVLVSANFKVVPAARAEATVLIERENRAEIEHDRQSVLRGRIRPIAFEARQGSNGWQEAVRIEGRPATVDNMARELADRLGDAVTLSTDESRTFWQTYVSGEALPDDPDILVIQLRSRPSDVHDTVQYAFSVFGDSIDDVRVSLGLGTVRIVISGAGVKSDSLIPAIGATRATGIDVVLLNAPDTIRMSVDTFGTPEPVLELMRQLKRQFDPWSSLNPGRVIPEL